MINYTKATSVEEEPEKRKNPEADFQGLVRSIIKKATSSDLFVE